MKLHLNFDRELLARRLTARENLTIITETVDGNICYSAMSLLVLWSQFLAPFPSVAKKTDSKSFHSYLVDLHFLLRLAGRPNSTHSQYITPRIDIDHGEF